MKKATENTRENTVRFIVSFMKERNYPPTVREICGAVGVDSSSTMHKILKQCVDEGFIEIDKGISRGIRVLPEGKKLSK
jgi:repressor LexA